MAFLQYLLGPGNPFSPGKVFIVDDTFKTVFQFRAGAAVAEGGYPAFNNVIDGNQVLDVFPRIFFKLPQTQRNLPFRSGEPDDLYLNRIADSKDFLQVYEFFR